MQPTETEGSHWDRRASRLLRVPFVHACSIALDGQTPGPGYIVNINDAGAYLASDVVPTLGHGLVCRFGLPGLAQDLEIRCEVCWVNPRQPHPVDGVPPGFGVKFVGLSTDHREAIESIVRAYTERQQPL
jgi:PilZ domain-containing protein